MDLISIDIKIFYLINHAMACPLLDGLMPFLSARGYLLLLPFVCYIFVKAYREQKTDSAFDISYVSLIAALSICSVFLSDWIGNELKHAIMRARPCITMEDVRLLAGCTTSGSMPSNHAANSFAYAIPLFYLTRTHISLRVRLYPVILAGFVALSRVYLGVHYPTDILAGALLGISVAGVLIMLYRFASQRYKTSPHSTLLVTGLAAISVFRIFYILHGPLDLSADEAHYWEWSRRLDLSYYSKGPMIAYLIRLGTFIFGNTVFGVRILAVVFSALSSIYIFKLVNLAYENEVRTQPSGPNHNSSSAHGQIAVLSALVFQSIPLFAAFGILFTIDSPFIFFWIISLYFFYEAVSKKLNEQHKYWFFLGFSIGCGLLTKYTMAFFPLCGMLLLIFSDKRYLLKTPMPYITCFISLAVFSPVIIWNMQHGWVTMLHTAGQAHIADGMTFSFKNLIEFIGSQIGIVTPLFYCLMAYALFKYFLSDKGFRSKFLFFFSIPVVAFFILKSCQGKVQANWAMFGYVTGIIAAVQFSIKGPSKTRQAFLAVSVSLALVLTVVSHYPSIVHLPQKLDPSARLRGWKELGLEVSSISAPMSKQGYLALFSDSYQIASELAFYVDGHPETFSINLGRRMDQYDLWPGINDWAARLRHQNATPVINGIFVKYGNEEMPPIVAQAYDHYEKKIFRVFEHGRVLREYSIFICYNFRDLKITKPETF
ncbi:MAG: glycosyltransferase family 39 protein [Nitrospirae bacterium]|nr:glycosyltransferase family 39 protein [Nitrospirota bacterium]